MSSSEACAVAVGSCEADCRRSVRSRVGGDRPLARVFDIAVASCVLVALAPVIVLAMLAVRLESPGPAIFRQTRIGRQGWHFTMYKLRSMRTGTDEVPTHRVDPASLTRAGRIMRRLRIDELPQLVNVLLGDMSLVGPRPCLPSQTDLIVARWGEGVFAVKPGITGLAQVNGVDMSQPARLAAVDGHYVRTRSFAGDLRLLLATVAGLRGHEDHVGVNG